MWLNIEAKPSLAFQGEKFNYWSFDITHYFLRGILRCGIIITFSQYLFFFFFLHCFFFSTEGVTKVYFSLLL